MSYKAERPQACATIICGYLSRTPHQKRKVYSKDVFEGRKKTKIFECRARSQVQVELGGFLSTVTSCIAGIILYTFVILRHNGMTCVANSCDYTVAIEACIAVRVLPSSPRGEVVSNALVSQSLHSNPSRRLPCHLPFSKYREESGLCIVRCIVRWGKPFLDTRVPHYHVTRVITAHGCVIVIVLLLSTLAGARRSQRLPHELRHA